MVEVSPYITPFASSLLLGSHPFLYIQQPISSIMKLLSEILVLATAALALPLADETPAATVENGTITSWYARPRNNILEYTGFKLVPQDVACTAPQQIPLPGPSPPFKCEDPAYTFSLGQGPGPYGYLVWMMQINHTLADG
jgi:hypothetical protein